MGKNNKARRAAKSKARAKARAHSSRAGGDSPGGPGFSDPWFTEQEVAGALWVMAARARYDESPLTPQAEGRLYDLPRWVAYAAAEDVLAQQVEACWAGGWQPADLQRQGRIGPGTAIASRLLDLAIAVDHARRPSAELDPRWGEQVERLDLPSTDGSAGWIARWAADERLDGARVIEVVATVLGDLIHLPTLDPLLPPPGRLGAGLGAAPPVTNAVRDPVLERIRNLLAKAESTEFEAEATALTAKAQELMTRHAIEAAMVEGDSGQVSTPVAVRVPVDAPYADAKSLLLQHVAESTRCRSVFLQQVSMSTVVGYPDDLAAVELLFTSLLVQAQHWLTDEAKRAAPGTRTRSAGYRSAFLVAYAGRIKDRLTQINAEVLDQATGDGGGAFLPVLRSKASAIDDYMAERFGETYTSPVRGGYDGAGWAGGWIAANSAQLNFGELADDPAFG